MKRKVFIISSSGRISEHISVRKILSENGIPSSIVNVEDQKNEKIISKLGRDLLFVKDDHSNSFYKLKKALFRHNIPFFSFDSLSSENINAACGNLDIGFNKDSFRNHIPANNIPEIPKFSTDISIDVPPESIPPRYLGYFKSSYLLSGNLISFLSSSGTRHKKINIIAPARPYEDNGKNRKILEMTHHLGQRSQIVSDLSCIPEGSTVLTWSTKRFLIMLSMGLRPVPLTRCLASSILFPGKTSFSDMMSYSSKQKFTELFHTLESLKLENNLNSIYKLLEY